MGIYKDESVDAFWLRPSVVDRRKPTEGVSSNDEGVGVKVS